MTRAAQPHAASPARIQAVESIGLTVSDMERSVRYFLEVLSFGRVSDVEVAGTDYEHLEGLFGLRLRRVRMRLGEELIDLTECLAPAGRPLPIDSRSNDRLSSTSRSWCVTWTRRTGGCGRRGDPRWQRATDRLFLGIDHTAIVVGDTDVSLGFYRDALGLRIAGESENYGIEQEHLNNIFGARLRITALRAAAGPGIDLLEYLAPRDGRPYPADSRANDLWQWQTRLVTPDAARAILGIRSAGGSWVSPGVVTLPEETLGMGRGATVRDPDGHALLVVER